MWWVDVSSNNKKKYDQWRDEETGHREMKEKKTRCVVRSRLEVRKLGEREKE